jgi:hypothetical protein
VATLFGRCCAADYAVELGLCQMRSPR